MLHPACRAHIPTTDRSPVAVRQQPEPRSWEYQDVRIPLHGDEAAGSDRRDHGKIAGTIRQNLSYLSQEGWEPDEALDLTIMRIDGVFKRSSDRDGHAVDGAVTIRVKRHLVGYS